MPEIEVFRLIVVFLLVIGLIGVCGWMAKRLGVAGATKKNAMMRVSARMPMGARSHVVVLDVEGARLVLGITPSSINLLHKLPAAEPLPTSEPGVPQGKTPLTFQSIFSQMNGAKRRDPS